ncbi:MAG: DUF1553 domain-containing protein, partial [Planctomycetota bacterium]
PRPQPGGPETVMVLHELEEARKTYRLLRGQYDQPDTSEPLSPATPEVLGGWNENWQANRLGLARWLVSEDNPLTARVTVNRYWQRFFGTGLVKTSENFGVQGDYPSHPELLDWLATEFVRRGWDVKAIHRLIVTSATYQQSSVASLELRLQDPENRWMARGPRKRLSPFSIRDAVLDASGLLSRRIGGPSVKPYMPPGIWSSVSNNKYKRDQGESLFRRSMYTYWRRTLPPPTMMSFNAAARETCTVRTELTTTPLQALTMMNNVTFIEAARHLAIRVLTEDHVDVKSRIKSAFRRVTSRAVRPAELKQLTADYEAYLREFKSDIGAATQLLGIGATKNVKHLDPTEVAALALVANTLFNLDEAITEN